MKNLLTATLPALALLALGGCASSGALVNTTESDGVYYSSQDKTTASGNLSSVYANRSAAGSPNPDGYAYGTPAGTTQNAPATTEDANPDYVAGTGSTTEGYNTSTLGANTDYYANNLTNGNYNGSGFGVPYTGPGVSSYNYSPTWSVAPAAYGSPFGYGLGLGIGYGYGGGFGYPYGGGFYSPYAYSGFYDPFYSSFYSPWGYGSGLSLGFGYGGFGYGGFGYPYGFGGYPAYGYGYGRGFYGDYGYGSYGRPVIRPYGAGSPAAGAVLIGGRPSRGGAAYGNSAMGNGSTSTLPGGRSSGSGMSSVAAPAGGSYVGPTGRGGRAVTFGNEAAGQGTAVPQGMPQQAQAAGARRGFFSGFLGGGNGGVTSGQPGSQPATVGSYGERLRGNYNYGGQAAGQPQMRNRSFSQPSYQQPSRSSFEQRSFSQPSPQRSFGGGSFGGGGGSFGGGGGGGRGRR